MQLKWPNTRWIYISAILAIIIITFSAYSNILDNDFVSDDLYIHVNNPALSSLSNPGALFIRPSLEFTASTIQGGALYRPLWLSAFWLNYRIWGPEPFGHHLFNLCLHIFNCLLVLSLIRLLSPASSIWGAVGGALLFAVHPAQTEAVAWASAAGHLLVSFFLLISMILYMQSQGTGSWLSPLGAVLTYALALFTQENAICFPLLIVTCDLLRGLSKQWPKWIMFLAVTTAYLVIRQSVLGSSLPGELNILDNWHQLPQSLAGYLAYFAFPRPLVLPLFEGLKSLNQLVYVTLGFAIIGGCILALLNQNIDRTLAATGLVWFAVLLGPVLGASLMDNPVFAQRFLYLPSIGLSVFLAALIGLVFNHRPQGILCVGLLPISALAVATFISNKSWQNERLLYSKMLESYPYSFEIQMSLGEVHLREENYAQAVDAYAMAATSAIGKKRGWAYSEAGGAAGRMGDYQLSEDYFTKALIADRKLSSAWLGKGNNAWQRNQLPEAIAHYAQAFELDTNNWQACYNLSIAYKVLGDSAKSAFYHDQLQKAKQRLESR